MGSTLFSFRGKGEWVRDGGSYFWFRALINRPSFRCGEEPWIKEFVKEAHDALDARWIMGIVCTGFDRYLIDDERISFMTREVLELHKQLREMASGVEMVYYLDDQVYSDYLVWVMGVIENLLLHPERLSITYEVES